MTGCSQKSSTVGSTITPGFNGQNPQEIFLDPDTAVFYSTYSNTGVSPFLYVGQAENYIAEALLKFNPYMVSLPDSYQVDSIVLNVSLDSIITPESNSLSISLHLLELAQIWTEIGVTWANLDSLPVGKYVATFNLTAEDTDSVSVHFFGEDPLVESQRCDSLLRAWEWASSGGKTLDFNNGIRLTGETSDNCLLRLASGENTTVADRPKLYLYLNVFDSLGSLVAEDSQFTLYAGGDAFIANYYGQIDSSYLYLGDAFAYRSLFLFNVDTLFPSYYDVAIQRAEINLHADTANTTANFDHITSAFPIAMADTSWIVDPLNAETIPSTVIYATYNVTAATLTVNLTDLVYSWIRYPGTNHGIMVRAFSEYYNIARTAFYGLSEPDSTLRPRLRIVYLEGVQ